MKLLSILVPCYNEESVIEAFEEEMTEELQKLKAGWSYEIVFVNDGSKDGTLEFLKTFANRDERNKYISFSRNFGKEAAMVASLHYCRGDCAVIIDADLQHPPALIHQMLDLYEKGYDQVIAKRTRTGDSRMGTFFAKTYYKIVNKIVEVQMVDGAGDFRLLSRPAINAIKSLPESNRFSKGLYSWIGFNQIYIEYENQQRAAGETKWSFRKLLKYGVEGVLSFNTEPLKLCIWMGGITIALSLVYLICLLIRIIVMGIDVPGYFTTIFVVSMIGGVQLLSLGIIGEYVGKIYSEVKRRPPYIVKECNISNTKNE